MALPSHPHFWPVSPALILLSSLSLGALIFMLQLLIRLMTDSWCEQAQCCWDYTTALKSPSCGLKWKASHKEATESKK